MTKYTSKEMIVELLQFLKKNKKQSILLEEYIGATSKNIKWTQKRIIALYKAVHETRAIVIDYFPKMKGESLIPCIRVSRTNSHKNTPMKAR